jgi:hypothetical protein
MKLLKKISTHFICSVGPLMLLINFYAIGQGQDSLINAPHVFYSAKPLGFITFLDENYKIRSYEDKIILLDIHNLPQDTFYIEKVKGFNMIQAVVRLDSKSFSLSTNQLSYLITVDSNRLRLLRQYSRGQVKKIVGPHHLAILTKDRIVAFNSKKRKGSIENECFIIDVHGNLVKRLDFFEKDEDVFKPNFIFPHHIQYWDGSLAFTSQSNNSYFIIDLHALKANELPLLPLGRDVISQMISYDFQDDQHYLIRIGKNNLVEVLRWDLNKNKYDKLNATFYPIHKILCGINNQKITFIGDFDNQQAWYLVPIKKMHEFNN